LGRKLFATISKIFLSSHILGILFHRVEIIAIFSSQKRLQIP